MSVISSVTSVSAVDALISEAARRQSMAPYLLGARDGRVLTYAQLDRMSADWQVRFRDAHIARASRVALSITDPLDFAVGLVAALREGLWVVPLDPTLATTRGGEHLEAASRLGATAYIGDTRDTRDTRADGLAVHILASRAPVATSDGDEEFEGGVILASSGTTGTPKVMALGQRRLLHAATTIARHHELSVNDRCFNPLPLFHINAEVVGVLSTLVSGSSLVLDDRFHRTRFWSMLDELEATWINAVPAIISRLVPLREGEAVPSRIRFCRSASAPLAPALLEKFEAVTGVSVVETYGMTEAASQICANPLREGRKLGSVGVPVGVELRVSVSDDGTRDAAIGVGHIEIRGPSVITAYESPGFEDRFREGWLRTGDVGYVDDDGYVYLVGRSDDVINRGGEKIYPREIEELILAHEAVSRVVVVARPDDVFGQVPVAYLDLMDVDGSTDEMEVAKVVEEICDLLVARVARPRRPATVHVVSSIPANPNGKVRKAAFRSGTPTVLFSRTLV